MTGVVSIQQAEDGSTTDSTDVQFEAFQLSDQAVRLWKDGWFQPHEKPTAGSCTLRNPQVSAENLHLFIRNPNVGAEPHTWTMSSQWWLMCAFQLLLVIQWW